MVFCKFSILVFSQLLLSACSMDNVLKEGAKNAPVYMKEPEMPSKRTVEKRGLSADQEEEAVRVHNQIRRAVSPGASNMKKMRYNKELAAASQAWADACLEGHSIREAAGENIFASSGDEINITQAIYSWDHEKFDYDYETDTCKEGKVCGHYTQAVWATSDQVGCGATNKCTDEWKTRIVCQYLANGNVRGIKPYMTGAPCSGCKTCGYSCDNGLCEQDTWGCTDCYIGDGSTYTGKYSRTASGRPCMNWKFKWPHYADEHQNYCRNFFSSEGFNKPLCYVSPTPGDWSVEYCEVPKCDCYTGDGSTYSGKYNTTASGRPCMNWKFKWQYYADEHQNYCRNFFSSEGFNRPLCYIDPTPGEWAVEYCEVPTCGE